MFAFITTQRKRAEFEKTRYVSHTPHVECIFWNICQLSASPLRSPITSFRCADVHLFLTPSPTLANTMIVDFRFCVIFPEKSILYIQNFVVLKNFTVCFTRRYFSYKTCTREIHVQILVPFVVIPGERGRKDHILYQKTPPNQQNFVPRMYNFL